VDLGLPDINGLSLIRTLRRHQRGLPILVLTALDAVDNRVTGLDAGADDYLVKPFVMAELEARARALWCDATAPIVRSPSGSVRWS